jgi:hypothetical protein
VATAIIISSVDPNSILPNSAARRQASLKRLNDVNSKTSRLKKKNNLWCTTLDHWNGPVTTHRWVVLIPFRKNGSDHLEGANEKILQVLKLLDRNGFHHRIQKQKEERKGSNVPYPRRMKAAATVVVGGRGTTIRQTETGLGGKNRENRIRIHRYEVAIVRARERRDAGMCETARKIKKCSEEMKRCFDVHPSHVATLSLFQTTWWTTLTCSNVVEEAHISKRWAIFTA